MRKKYLILAKTYDKKGRLIATATNLPMKSHPLQKSLAEKVGLPMKDRLHAELGALLPKFPSKGSYFRG